MDVEREIAVSLRVRPDQARALVGGVLGLVAEELWDHLGFEAERAFATEVPELETWRVEALRQLGQAGRTTYGEPRVREALDAVWANHRGAANPAPEGTAVNRMIDVLAPGIRAEDDDPRGPGRRVLTILVRFLHGRLSPTLFAQVLEVSPLLRRMAEPNHRPRGI